MKCLVIAIFAGLVVAAPREKRQVLPNCADTDANVSNPCLNNPTKRVYFPHPWDANKFIQCDVFGRMLIIRCPSSEIYNHATTTCVPPQTTPATINTVLASNPCTPQNLGAGRIYFAISTDKTQFIECDLNGNANVLTCPAQLEWDQNRWSCVYKFEVGITVTTMNPNSGALGGAQNPCTASGATQFYSHPDATKFIQCDIAGDAYVLSCPSGLVWNQFSTTCVSPYTITG